MADEPKIASAWTRPRRQRETLSREQIVAEAVKLLDAEGVEALSMRTLGTRMGTAATSLYRHVTNRDELIEFVVDEVYGEIEVPDGSEGWRASVTACAGSVRAMILRHPWIASLLGQVGLSYLGPNVMRLNDRMLALFEGAGEFGPVEADKAISAVMAFVIGMGVSEAAWLTSLARSGQDEREWVAELAPAAVKAAEPYPHLRAHVAAGRVDDMRQTRDEHFTYGLNAILDGLQPRRPS
ncbi:TetR/AcrR family transcriptional regulator C-terminal domain-containing protein [Allokutzneria sp. A3M-2-11 16]|uniref:TetR/AcrR family transcriptional regulator C-terminal domain-containing protein n=1 Tax=Allokutzneria sp. A3M-2-11 16 TaxID=2962043 RepID=UPI0020B7DA5D|nr:TetR/AcrR family transcriptional regulator C-terminal domain-containing protein [Allokutzneria sp. A3M-2-11 16]MCP3802389.1 TetR/AcrR family transcriptional regulator C-terminal domain-containing protein [Allokutzneria sp. A3M-2-11 16]